MAREITLKIENCFDDNTYQTEVNVKTPEGKILCAFTVRQLTVYDIGRAQSAKPEDVEQTYANLIKTGLVSLYEANGNGSLTPVEVNEANIKRLSKSHLTNGVVIPGLFETIAQAILDANGVSEAEAKNSV